MNDRRRWGFAAALGTLLGLPVGALVAPDPTGLTGVLAGGAVAAVLTAGLAVASSGTTPGW